MGIRLVECTQLVDALELGDRYHMKKTEQNVEVTTSFITNLLQIQQAVHEHKPIEGAMDYLLSKGYRVDPEASVAVDSAVSYPVFDQFKKRIAEEYASKTVRSLQASVRFTKEEVEAQPPITGEVNDDLIRALTTQEPQTPEVQDVIIIKDEQATADDWRKRPRSETATAEPVLQPKPKLASTQPKFASFVSTTDQSSSAAASSSSGTASREEWEKQMRERYSSVEALRQAKMSGELYSSLRPDVPAGISKFEVAADATPPRPTVDATIYMKPWCPELLPHP